MINPGPKTQGHGLGDPADSLMTSVPTTASGGRFGEQKAANLRASTLVTRLPRNSWFWKKRPTWAVGHELSTGTGIPVPTTLALYSAPAQVTCGSPGEWAKQDLHG